MGQIDENQYEIVYPKNAKVGRAHGTAKIHKEFERIPHLRPIIDTIGSTYYGVGKFVSQLLNPLRQNTYSLKDSFEAAYKIKVIPQTWYDEGYRLISSDVVSLFSNVTLWKTVNAILDTDKVYKDKVIKTNLKMRMLEKLQKQRLVTTISSMNKPTMSVGEHVWVQYLLISS